MITNGRECVCGVEETVWVELTAIRECSHCRHWLLERCRARISWAFSYTAHPVLLLVHPYGNFALNFTGHPNQIQDWPRGESGGHTSLSEGLWSRPWQVASLWSGGWIHLLRLSVYDFRRFPKRLWSYSRTTRNADLDKIVDDLYAIVKLVSYAN